MREIHLQSLKKIFKQKTKVKESFVINRNLILVNGSNRKPSRERQKILQSAPLRPQTPRQTALI